MKKEFGQAVHRVRASGLDSAVLVAAGVVVAVLGALGIANMQLVASISVALLATVAAVVLKVEANNQMRREASDRMADSMTRLLNRLDGDHDAGRALRFEYPDLRNEIANAVRIDVVAGLALNVINQYMGDLQQAVRSGASTRFLCPDPEEQAIVQLSLYRSVFRTEPVHVVADVKSHLEFAASLGAETSNSELFTVPYLPPFGMVRITTGYGTDTIYIKLMAFKVGAGQFPVIALTDPSSDWFRFFEDQMEKYFSLGVPYSRSTNAGDIASST